MTAGKINLHSPSNSEFYGLISFIFMVIFINFNGYDFYRGKNIFYFLLNLTLIIFI
jgi:hypothetical protein